MTKRSITEVESPSAEGESKREKHESSEIGLPVISSDDANRAEATESLEIDSQSTQIRLKNQELADKTELALQEFLTKFHLITSNFVARWQKKAESESDDRVALMTESEALTVEVAELEKQLNDIKSQTSQLHQLINVGLP